MMNCQKCQKEYIPKRMGGLFCSVSCGNSYRQQLKRNEQKQARLLEQGLAIEKPLTEEEVQIWSVLVELGKNARQLDEDLQKTGNDRPADIGPRIGKIIRQYREQADSKLWQQFEARLNKQEEVTKRVSSKQ
ncbi:MAG: hypothetical protein EOP33_08335 [Rickettsiaceae bacterium]|nr:MAG: hypothetical protein EOP33_08335 [Rickettsiaceae bacterium]